MKLNSIQVLRALAVLMVVAFHFNDNLQAGRGGVDLFFVISGFIMATVMPGKQAWPFFKARLRRIIPTYWAAMALLFLLHPHVPDMARLVSSLFLVPGTSFILYPAWTLVFEFTFYLGCGLVLAWGRWALLLIPAAFLIQSAWPNDATAVATSPLMLEFAAGVLIAFLPKRHGWAFIAASAIGWLALYGHHRVISYGIPSALLVYGALGLEPKFANWRFPVLIGDASYSIYLTHWIFVPLLPNGGWWLLSAYGTVLIGIAFYWVVERGLAGKWRLEDARRGLRLLR